MEHSAFARAWALSGAWVLLDPRQGSSIGAGGEEGPAGRSGATRAPTKLHGQAPQAPADESSSSRAALHELLQTVSSWVHRQGEGSTDSPLPSLSCRCPGRDSMASSCGAHWSPALFWVRATARIRHQVRRRMYMPHRQHSRGAIQALEAWSKRWTNDATAALVLRDLRAHSLLPAGRRAGEMGHHKLAAKSKTCLSPCNLE